MERARFIYLPFSYPLNLHITDSIVCDLEVVLTLYKKPLLEDCVIVK